VRVLIVEDEPRMAELIVRGLEEEDHLPRSVGRGEDAIAETLHGEWDAIVLDVGLPGMDGFVTCRALRDRGVRVPVLMLTAYDDIDDRVSGLDAGADDYLVKPFAFDELLARLRALDRRARGTPEDDRLRAGDLSLDARAHRAWRGRTELKLSAREFALLEAFLRRPGRLLTRSDLLAHAWEDERPARSNLVDVYVGYLRGKVDRPWGLESLETVRGEGYRLREDGGRA
jgi:two-component system OmpR family response regulator